MPGHAGARRRLLSCSGRPRRGRAPAAAHGASGSGRRRWPRCAKRQARGAGSPYRGLRVRGVLAMTTCCDGLVVLELGSGSIAGALCGMLLADNGARVLKVEPPAGDRMRRDVPSGFLVWCRGKESVVIDLRTGGGPREFLDLARYADVVIDGFAPGVTADWGSATRSSTIATPGWCTARSPPSAVRDGTPRSRATRRWLRPKRACSRPASIPAGQLAPNPSS